IELLNYRFLWLSVQRRRRDAVERAILIGHDEPALGIDARVDPGALLVLGYRVEQLRLEVLRYLERAGRRGGRRGGLLAAFAFILAGRNGWKCRQDNGPRTQPRRHSHRSKSYGGKREVRGSTRFLPWKPGFWDEKTRFPRQKPG